MDDYIQLFAIHQIIAWAFGLTIILHVLLILPLCFGKGIDSSYRFVRWISAKRFWKLTDYIWLGLAILGAQSFYDYRLLQANERKILDLRSNLIQVLSETSELNNSLKDQKIFYLNNEMREFGPESLPIPGGEPGRVTFFSRFSYPLDCLTSLTPGSSANGTATGDCVAMQRMEKLKSDLTLRPDAFVGTLSEIIRILQNPQAWIDKSGPIMEPPAAKTSRPSDPFIVDPYRNDENWLEAPKPRRTEISPTSVFLHSNWKKIASLAEPQALQYAELSKLVAAQRDFWSVKLRQVWAFLLGAVVAVRLTKTTAEAILEKKPTASEIDKQIALARDAAKSAKTAATDTTNYRKEAKVAAAKASDYQEEASLAARKAEEILQTIETSKEESVAQSSDTAKKQ